MNWKLIGACGVSGCLVTWFALCFTAATFGDQNPGYCTGICQDAYIHTVVGGDCGSAKYDDVFERWRCETADGNRSPRCTAIDQIETSRCVDYNEEPTNMTCTNGKIPLIVHSYFGPDCVLGIQAEGVACQCSYWPLAGGNPVLVDGCTTAPCPY